MAQEHKVPQDDKVFQDDMICPGVIPSFLARPVTNVVGPFA